MTFQKLTDQEDITNQYINDTDEVLPLTKTTLANEEKKVETFIDSIPAHIEGYLQTKPTFGLSEEEVLGRRKRFGKNELSEKKRNKLLHFLSFCKTT